MATIKTKTNRGKVNGLANIPAWVLHFIELFLALVKISRSDGDHQARCAVHAKGTHVLAGNVVWKVPLQQRIRPQVDASKAVKAHKELWKGGGEISVNAVGRRTKDRLHLIAVVPVVVHLVADQPRQVPDLCVCA